MRELEEFNECTFYPQMVTLLSILIELTKSSCLHGGKKLWWDCLKNEESYWSTKPIKV